jgi:ribose 5-phosphate isomerase B
MTMRIAIGSDEEHATARGVLAWLQQHGHDVQTVGVLDGPVLAWPHVALGVARAVASGQADEGILFCWTGTGVTLAANKVHSIRAVLCHDAETARGARLWNNANVLCLSLRSTSPAVAEEILQAWFATRYQPNPEDDACLAAIREIEAENASATGAP